MIVKIATIVFYFGLALFFLGYSLPALQIPLGILIGIAALILGVFSLQ